MTKTTRPTDHRKADSKKKKTIIAPAPESNEADDLGPLAWVEYLEETRPTKLLQTFGPGSRQFLREYRQDKKGKWVAKCVVIPVQLFRICPTLPRASVLSRILYYAGARATSDDKLPEELRDTPGPWMRSSVSSLARQCRVARSTVNNAIDDLEKRKLIDVLRHDQRIYIHPNYRQLIRAVR